MAVEIEATDVIKVILQFCKENGLHNSFKAMQKECGITLNTVDNVSDFLDDIKQGRWDKVLVQVANLKLPAKKVENLHEHVILELVELREVETARGLLHRSEALSSLRKTDPERYIDLERTCNKTVIDARKLYNGVSRQKKRNELAKSLQNEVMSVPPSRLMVLIGQAIKWQKQEGLIPPNAAFDVFSGMVPKTVDDEDIFPSKDDITIRFGSQSYPECAIFLGDGISLVTGSVDGFIEVWDILTGKLKLDLPYQASEKFMMHEAPVLALSASSDDEILASGCKDGEIKIWRISNGHCIRKFSAHSQGITSLMFSAEKSRVLSSSLDNTVRIHGIKSGKMLKELRGHESFVNSAVFNKEGNAVLSASSDCTIRVWSISSAECTTVFRAPQSSSTSEEPVLSATYLPKSSLILVCLNSKKAYIMTESGEVIKSFELRDPASDNFIACKQSNHGAYIYALTADGQVACFNFESTRLEKKIRVLPGKAIGMALHPTRNILAAFCMDGSLKALKS